MVEYQSSPLKMDETLNSPPALSLSSLSLTEATESKHQSPSTSSLTPTLPPTPSSVTRLWRPAAQRNLRNQWSKLASYKQQWLPSSTSGRSHATSLVNSYLSQRYMKDMELGVLSDMHNIRKKACRKLLKQQELHQSKLLSSYKDMVAVVKHMVNTSRSMRCFLKGGSSTPIVQFSSYSTDENDNGHGGGIPVFLFLSISSHEKFAEEFVRMYVLELYMKRLLVVELLSISSEEGLIDEVCWSDELYPREFDDLSICGLYSEEDHEPVLPKLNAWKNETTIERSNNQPDHEALQVYLTTWLAEVNIDKYRVDEIFAVIGEEMHVALS